MQDSSLPLYFSNAIKRCSVVGFQLNNIKTQSTEDTEELLEELNHLCDHDDVVVFFIENNFHIKLIRVFEEVEPRLQKLVVKILNRIIKLDDNVKSKLREDKEFISILTVSFTKSIRNQSHLSIQEMCLNFLVEIYGNELKSLVPPEQQAVLLQCVIDSFNWDNLSIVYHSIALLNIGFHCQTLVTGFLGSNMRQVIVKLSTAGTNHRMGIKICRFLSNGLNSQDSTSIFNAAMMNNLDESLIKILFEGYTTITEEYYLVGISLLNQLLYFYETCRQNLNLVQSFKEYSKIVLQSYQHIIAIALLEAMQTYNVQAVLIAGLKTFYLTLSVTESSSTTILNKTDQIAWLGFIHEIIVANMDCMELVEWSFKVLFEMITSNNNLINQIGFDKNQRLIAIDSGIIQIFYTQNNLNVSSFIASCNLVSILSSNSESIQNRFLESNLQTIIHWLTIRLTHNIRGTRADFLIRISATNALRSLVIFNLPAKELFFNEEIQYREVKTFLSSLFGKGHSFHSPEFYEVVAVNLLFLTSLVEFNPFKYDLILGKEFNLSQIAICDDCTMNESMIEAIQELMIVLSGSESENDLFLDVWTLDFWLHISSVLLNCYAIQKNTMVFLQLNTSKIEEINRQQILFKISEFIFRATKLYKDSLVIQVEAFVLLKIILTEHPSFLKCCLEFDLDKYLFDSISKVWNDDVIKVGLQALYILIESNKNRERIIENSIKKGHVKMMEFLFNYGTNISSNSIKHLLSSVKLKPDELSLQITSILLRNGCLPDSEVILTCLTSENWSTAGLLLSVYGINGIDSGSCINWSELGLQKVHLSWYRRLYQGIGDFRVDQRIKWLSRRIKYESMNVTKLQKSTLKSGKGLTRYPLTQSRTLENDIGGFDYHTKVKDKAKLSKDDDELVQLSVPTPLDHELSRSMGSMSTMKERLSATRQRRKTSGLGLFMSHRSDNIVQSVENLSINNCVTQKKKSDFTYVPLPDEVDEFFLTFRSGSDYTHHQHDPRCIITSKRRRTTGTVIITLFGSRSSLNNFIKKKNSIMEHNDGGAHSSNSEVNNLSDYASETINNVTVISQLDLSRNVLQSIDVFMEISGKEKLVKMFDKMTVLKLHNNNIKTLPGDIFCELVSLEHLDISVNMLTEFPWVAFRYCKLIYLNLTKNKLRSFTMTDSEREDLKSYGRVSMLKTLLFAENEIKEFSMSTLTLFSNLERMELQLNQSILSKEDVLPLANLKKITLKNSFVSFNGKSLFNSCRDIQNIDLSECQLLPFEDVFPIRLSLLENITSLNVSHNNLACHKPFYIPKCILKIPKLQRLNISFNNIVEFPACSMWVSTTLTDLDFSHNSIHTLNLLNAKPNFQTLQTLNVSNNRLKELPPEIGQLSSLNLLNISFNPSMTSLPDEIGMLKNKKFNSLIIDGLNLDIKKILNPNPRLLEILKYYHNRLKNSIEYYGLKIMVLGHSGRGKTTLLQSLQGKRKEKTRTSITIGINVSKWKFSGKFNDKQVQFKFSCWDLAGQEDFYSSHECFISQRALYLVVFDLTKGIEDINYLRPWLLNLKSQAPHAPIIIIGTHLDNIKEENRENQCLFLKKNVYQLCVPPAFPKISSFIAVDGRNPNKSIDYLKSTIIRVLESHRIQNEPIIGEKQPASYLRLEEILQDHVKNLHPQYPIMVEKEVKEIVQKNNLDIDDDELKQALQFLHNCGVIVHFDDVINRLKNLYFINPQWLCSMMAQIITMKALNPYINNGTMKLAHFVEIFVKQNFVSKMPKVVKDNEHAMQCLKILEKFDVVFQRSNNEIIIPSMLPLTKPVTDNKEDKVTKIRRLFEFCFLPTGFWPRLLTRIIVLSQTFDYLFSAPHRELHIWKQGVIMSWENSIFLHLEGRRKDKEIIDVAVTMSELGLKILVQIIDSIEVLIEEWYPGLLESDITGTKMMKTFALCPYCDYNFPTADIMLQSETSDQIKCPQCYDTSGSNRNIEIRVIAPDIVLGDLPSYLIVNPSLLNFDKSQENQIGSGGNGCVYHGRYNGENCAIKYLNAPCTSSDSPSYRLLRQEIDILRRLRHSSLISLIAVDREKIILEFAALGDLSTILKSHQLGRRYLQRVAYQVIDGIDFLHEKNIIYRDLKMHNILVFSLELSAAINIKLSDYGISRVMTYFGFVNFQGTPGYQAPEVIQRHQEYNLQSDIFSYGIVLFNIATGGKHPSDNKPHWRPGINMELISTFGCNNWPRMQECIDGCLENTPDDRPVAKAMIDFITCPSFITIKAVRPLTKQTRIECMVTKSNDEGRVEVLLTNGDLFKQEVRWMDILSGQTKGKSFVGNSKRTRVLCATIFDNIALLGTQSGEMWIYKYLDDTFSATNISLLDSILAITIVKTSDNVRILIIGLANGTIGYKVGFSAIQDLSNDDFMVLNLNNDPVRNLCIAHDNIFATSGPSIYKLIYSAIDEQLHETKIVEITSRSVDRLIRCFHPVTENINHMRVVSFYFSIRNQSLVYHYDDQGNELKPPIDCDILIRQKFSISKTYHRTKIMCMSVYGSNRYIAIGTSDGYLIVLDQKINHVTILKLFRNPIICLQHTKPDGRITNPDKERPSVTSSISILEKSISVDENTIRNRSKNSWLIVVGNGYRSIHTEENDGAVLLLMSDDVPRVSRQLDEHIHCRQNIKKNI